MTNNHGSVILDYTKKPVQKRTKLAIEFAVSWAHEYKPKQIAFNIYRSQVGNTSDRIPGYLFNMLFIRVDDMYSANRKIAMKYLLNRRALTYLQEQLVNPSKQSYNDWLKLNKQDTALSQTIIDEAADRIYEKHKEDIDNGSFHYEHKADRLFTSIQYVKSTIRDRALARGGIKHNYDIKCAAVALIYQYALRSVATIKCEMIECYVADRSAFRAKIAADTGIPLERVKTVLTAMFMGARIDGRRAIGKILGERLDAFKQHTYIRGLRLDINRCWRAIKTTTYTHNDKMTARLKSDIYRRLESQVMAPVKHLLDSIGAKYLLIHDGFIADKQIPIFELSRAVYEATKYSIEFEYSE